MTTALNPDPAMIGGVAKAPLVRLPAPETLFAARADRLDFLAGHSANLGPYLRFLATLCRAQARLAAILPAAPAPKRDWVDLARSNRMPQIDRHHLKADLPEVLDSFLPLLDGIAMPESSRLALEALRAANPDERDWLFDNIVKDRVPEEAIAPHLLTAAAVQVHAARHAAALDPEALVPIRTGVCPACGGAPSASMVTDSMTVEGTRYAACSCCQTLWNEVRIHCLNCGKNDQISYRSVEVDEAQIKAELCGGCGHWLKILSHNRNPSLEIVADDVASLGLDLKMKADGHARAGFNPFLVGV